MRACETGDPSAPLLLAIETSCDETAAAVLDGERSVRSSVVHSQMALHSRFGGVVPELASRAHVMAIGPVVKQALREAGAEIGEIRAVAVTQGPGLVGCLLVGIEYARGIGLALGIPVVGVNHVAGHLAAATIEVEQAFEEVQLPCVGLVVSGGHTSLYAWEGEGRYRELARTLDDAAGEAFDKAAAMLGLPYPGGAEIDRLAREGDPAAFRLPRPLLRRNARDFSFSGVKTAFATLVAKRDVRDPSFRRDAAASFQEAVVDVLVTRALRAARDEGEGRLVVSGGVASNSRLRSMLAERSGAQGVAVSIPPARLCTDNAAMIGAAGWNGAIGAIRSGLWDASGRLDAEPGARLEDASNSPAISLTRQLPIP